MDYVSFMKRQKLYQFLMRLNDSYDQARSQILLMYLLPTVNQAFSMIMSDGNQKSIAATTENIGLTSPILNENYESTALYSVRSGGFQTNFQPNSFHSNNPQQSGNYSKQ